MAGPVLDLVAIDRALRASWDVETCDDADVHEADGSLTYHWWLRTTGGVELDLTRDQFEPGDRIGPPRFLARPTTPVARSARQYALLRERVLRRLGLADAD